MTAKLRPQAAAYLESIRDQVFDPAITPQEVREFLLQKMGATKNDAPDCDVYNETLDCGKNTIRLRCYHPLKQNDKSPLVLFIHGGGWIMCSVDTHDPICRVIADRTQSVVVSVDYTLAPEAKQPEILGQCHQALQWCVQHADKLNIDLQKISLVGDSAGGQLAAALSFIIRDEAKLNIHKQVLVCASLDLQNMDSDSYNTLGEYGLTCEKMQWFKKHFLPENIDVSVQTVSPLLANSHANLPEALIIVSEYDVIRDDGIAYAEKLCAAGVDVECYVMQGMVHSGIFWARVMPLVDDVIDKVCLFL